MEAGRRRKLTEAMAGAAVVPAGKQQVILWDGAVVGLGLRCLSGGSKTWVYVYRAAGGGRGAASQTLRLGSWPSVSVESARTAARSQAGAVARGRDPAAERREDRRREKATLRIALDDYERTLVQRRLVNVRSVMSALRRGLAPLMTRDARTLTRGDYVGAITAIERKGRMGAAEDLRKHSRTFAEWCVGRGLADYNPLAGLRRPRLTRAERLHMTDRGRALRDDEIAMVWCAADDLGSFGALVQMALLTGMRRGELAGLRWGDVKADRIVLEAQHTKSGVAHEVPLTNFMRVLLSRQPRTSVDLVFPSRTNTRISGWTQLIRRLVGASGVGLTMHDARRTCRTLMSRLEVAEDIAELAIGHQRADLVGRYNRDVAWSRRAEAFDLVSHHIAEIVGDTAGNLVVFAKRARPDALIDADLRRA